MLALFHALLGLSLFGPFLLSGSVRAGEPLIIEVFTAAENRPGILEGSKH